MATLRRLIALLPFVATASCGGGNGGPAGPSLPDNPNRITISATGAASPAQLIVTPGARVLFINEHARPHQMSSDPHPEHTDCPEINQVGVLTQGQSRETGNLVVTRTCGFHDHDNPDNAGLRGRIIIR